jgi:hypothetical protein
MILRLGPITCLCGSYCARAALILTLVCTCNTAAETRTWTNNTGAQIQADFVKFDASTQKVILRLTNGRESEVPLQSLSHTDIEFVKGPQSVASDVQQVALRLYWDTPLQVKAVQGKELKELLGPNAQATTELTATPKIEIYKNVYYLQKLEDAKQQLFAGKSVVNLASRMQIGTSGFPASSLFFYDFRCDVHPGFKHVVIITDSADQVVSIQFLENAPKSSFLAGHSTKWSTYNFVQNRRKAKPTYLIAHAIQNSNPDVLCWKSELLDDTGKSREWVEWYLPKKLAGLILHVLEK